MYARLSLGTMFLAVVTLAVGCAAPHLPHSGHNLPPAQRIMAPGPGVGLSPGVMPPPVIPQGPPVAAPSLVQVWFSDPESMEIAWDVTPGGNFNSEPLITPGRTNFPQGGIYRLKLTNIRDHVGTELYPTLEIGPTNPRTAAFLAHAAIPVQFTDEDFDQVKAGNLVTKVIYLPDPEFQDLALPGVATLVSTRLDPGENPVVEADRRGSIMAIIRMGNKDLEIPQGGGFGVQGVGYQQAAAGAAVGVSAGGATPAAIGGSALYRGPAPIGGPSSMGGLGPAPPYVAGATAPQYGLPIGPTPIGLPGPPHIPFGSPAGLQRHVMHNHTHQHIPGPTPRLDMHVQQNPGLTYPAPPNRVFVKENTIGPKHAYGQPYADQRHIRLAPGVVPQQGPGHSFGGFGAGLHGAAADCPDGNCQEANAGQPAGEATIQR